MKLQSLTACIMVASLCACQVVGKTTTPEELIGVWETSAPTYKGCEIEIKDDLIIFRNEANYANINYLNRIRKSGEAERILYTLYYENRKGVTFKSRLFYFKTNSGGAIRFVNQAGVTWKRKKNIPRGSPLPRHSYRNQ